MESMAGYPGLGLNRKEQVGHSLADKADLLRLLLERKILKYLRSYGTLETCSEIR